MGVLTVHQQAIEFLPSPRGKGMRLQAVQVLPRCRREVFEFFSDASRLEILTPPWLSFSVRTPAPIQLASGTLIDYRLRLHGVPLRWQSRISVWDPPYRFVDEQTRGPYRHWHHEHIFEEGPEGTICRDLVDYEVFGGWLADRFLVRRDLAKIFRYRQHKLDELFSVHPFTGQLAAKR
jgi:ligand-binding SRPBCC domain-containing protein